MGLASVYKNRWLSTLLLIRRTRNFQLLTASEAAELIRLPRSSVYEFVRNRRIPFVRIGRRVFFVRDALVRWLIEEMSVPPRTR